MMCVHGTGGDGRDGERGVSRGGCSAGGRVGESSQGTKHRNALVDGSGKRE